ncbi:MAG: DegT/DnrJ/EryC1/StrS family aminotransferase [Terracidiphilus sp.]|nr:DegT/DnrJ/EryC1/StrS family aminotransferase [Terracidiphilus sp.]
MSEQLAILGGNKTINTSLPHFNNAAGRTLGHEEEELVLKALRSGCLSRNGGTMVKELEKEFGEALGVPSVVACSSGTASVHLAIAALDLEPGDEVIVPPITDMGSILPVLWQNAIPVFADVDPRTMLIDPASVEKLISPRTRAVVAVHLAGTACALDELLAICRKHKIVLIEDSAQAYWTEYKGKLAGTIGDIGCFSLQQSKHMTCGEGGLTVTSNEAFARRALLFSDKAWPRESGSLGACRFLFLSQNYRMSELAGAVALAQLKKVKDTVARRRVRAAQLTASIDSLRGVSGPFIPNGVNPSYWLYMLHIGEESGTNALEFGNALVAEGVSAWVRYIIDPLYLSPVFAKAQTYGKSGYPFSVYPHQNFVRGLCPNAEKALSKVIAIHWNENYTAEQVDQISAAIHKVANHFASR